MILFLDFFLLYYVNDYLMIQHVLISVSYDGDLNDVLINDGGLNDVLIDLSYDDVLIDGVSYDDVLIDDVSYDDVLSDVNQIMVANSIPYALYFRIHFHVHLTMKQHDVD